LHNEPITSKPKPDNRENHFENDNRKNEMNSSKETVGNEKGQEFNKLDREKGEEAYG
jgi:hypothetical protein